MNIIDRIKSSWFWFRHGTIVARMIDIEHEKRIRAAYKGHETRERRYLPPHTIVIGTECDK